MEPVVVTSPPVIDWHGDRVTLRTAGAGGYGDPTRRNRQSLAADYLDGKVSAEKIEQDYGVDIESEIKAPIRPAVSKA